RHVSVCDGEAPPVARVEEAARDETASEEDRVVARAGGGPDEPRARWGAAQRVEGRQCAARHVAVARRKDRVRDRVVKRRPVTVELCEAPLVPGQRAAL